MIQDGKYNITITQMYRGFKKLVFCIFIIKKLDCLLDIDASYVLTYCSLLIAFNFSCWPHFLPALMVFFIKRFNLSLQLDNHSLDCKRLDFLD